MKLFEMLFIVLVLIAWGAVMIYVGCCIGRLTITSNSVDNVKQKKPTMKQRREKKKLDKQQDEVSARYQRILDNLDVYDGTGNGQKEID